MAAGVCLASPRSLTSRRAVLALVTDGIGRSGGIGEYNRDLMRALAQSDRVGRVTVLPRFAAEALVDGKITHLAPSASRTAWSLRAAKLALGRQHDIIFCGHLRSAPLAAALAQLTAARLWLQVHGIEAWQQAGTAIVVALGRADLVTAVSRYTRGRLLDWSDVSPITVRVLPNTVSSAYVPAPKRADLVTRWGLAGRRVVLTVGRLASAERYKGHDRVIAALPDVAARVPSVVYMIVGAGDDIERLQAKARMLHVEDRVIFTGHVGPDEMVDHFALGDVFCMPSTGEGFGIVFLEAVRSGLAVIGGNHDGSVDPLADGAIGTLIDPENKHALASALVDALTTDSSSPDPHRADRFAYANFARHVDDLVHSLS